jgi:DNA-binding beta-propeller fold protein YncE
MWRDIRTVMLGVLLAAAAAGFLPRASDAQDAKPKSDVPVFQADASWPKLPENLRMGMIMGIAVDSHDHVWMVHRPGSLSAKDKEQAAPPVVEFDAAGNYIQGWGGPGEGFEWPGDRHEHGIFVDAHDNVWICSTGLPNDNTEHQILKFTKTGKFVMQIGHRGKGKGSNDPENLAGASDVFVDPNANEVYVADGYRNRRVIVFDANTGAFKRYWGAYGNKPDDSAEPGSNANLQQFAIVHHVVLSNDGLVYVADHLQGRVQVFTPAGKFVKERIIARDTKPRAGTVSIAFSPDRQQRFLYVPDLRRWVIDVLDRQTLETVEVIGHQGTQPGEFVNPHNIAADSKGNLYIAEMGVQAGGGWTGRAQKLVFKGNSKP